jgi:cbb3-type cytochrome oxidase cytochrome c subunit
MNNGPLIFVGLLFTMLWSYYGFVVTNFRDVGRQEPFETMTGEKYPTGRSGTANLGQDVYRANGCASCHTMQVRTRVTARHRTRLGKRNTVLRDFLWITMFSWPDSNWPDLATVALAVIQRLNGN